MGGGRVGGGGHVRGRVGGGGQGGCERRIEVYVKIQKKLFLGRGGVGGGEVDLNGGEVKFFEN